MVQPEGITNLHNMLFSRMVAVLVMAIFTTTVQAQNSKDYWKDHCSGLQDSKFSNHAPEFSQSDFTQYIRELEEINPGKNWKQIAAALHAARYGDDLARTLPGLPINLFKQGPETDGWKDVNIGCGLGPLENRASAVVPKFVRTKRGKKVDVGHTYAAIRSDLNREDKGSAWSTFMRNANTNLGDLWQVILHRETERLPPDQLRGNLMGIQIARHARNPHIQDNIDDLGLVDFFDHFFDNVDAANEREKVIAEHMAGKPPPDDSDRRNVADDIDDAERQNGKDAATTPRSKANSLIAAIEADLRVAEAFTGRLQAQCQTIGNLPDVDNPGEMSLSRFKSEMIEPAMARMPEARTAWTTAKALMPVIRKSSNRAVEESERACGIDGRSDSDIEIMREAAVKARNHAALTAQVANEAIAAGESAIALMAKLAGPSSIEQRLAERWRPWLQMCGTLNSSVDSGFSSILKNGLNFEAPGYKAELQAKARLAELLQLLKNPQVSGEIEFIMQFAALKNRVDALPAGRAVLADCKARYLACADATLTPDFPGPIRQELIAYAEAYKQVIQLDPVKMRHWIDGAKRRVRRAEQHATKARECVADAQSTAPPLATEAARLGDLSGVACTSDAIAGRLQKINQSKFENVPSIDEIRAKLRLVNSSIFNAWAHYTTAKKEISRYRTDNSNYNLRMARESLNNASQELNSLPKQLNCEGLREKVLAAQRTASRLEGEANKDRETFSEAEHRCQVKYRSQFLKVTGKPGNYNCRFCKKDYEPKGGSCIPTQSSANEWCDANNKGSGYVAVKRKADGTFGCRLSRSAANRWCNRNRNGTGWIAHAFDKKGGFKCRRPKTSKNRRTARADCRRQVKAAKKVYAYTKFNKDGSYDCRWCPRGHYYKKGKCHARQRTRQRVQQRQQRKTGTLYQCWKCPGGICSYGSTRQKYYSKWNVPGGKCRRVR